MSPGIRKGEPWGGPATGPPDVSVAGDDAALAAVVADHVGGRISWTPTPASDFARSVGSPGAPRAELLELPCDALAIGEPVGTPSAEARRIVVNMAVLGTGPDRQRRFTRSTHLHVVVDGRVLHDGPATGVVVANGEFLRGGDVVPRGHPGDGRAEVQVYAVEPRQRRSLRARVATGAHLPHPGIRQGSGRRIEVVGTEGRPLALELDGVEVDPTARLVVTVLARAFLLLT